MKMRRFLLSPLLVVSLVGCLGDSSQTSDTTTLTVATEGVLPMGTALAGVGMTLTLPTGVTPVFDADGEVDTGALVTPSGAAVDDGLETVAVYLPPSSQQPARVALAVASRARDGIGVDETMRVRFQRPHRARYLPEDFGISGVAAIDLEGRHVDGVTAVVTAVGVD